MSAEVKTFALAVGAVLLALVIWDLAAAYVNVP